MTLEHDDEPPPLLGTWRNVYRAVALYLVGIITLFWLLGRTFTR